MPGQKTVIWSLKCIMILLPGPLGLLGWMCLLGGKEASGCNQSPILQTSCPFPWLHTTTNMSVAHLKASKSLSWIPESVPSPRSPSPGRLPAGRCPRRRGACWKPAPQLQQELGPRRQLPSHLSLCPHLHSRSQSPSSQEGVNRVREGTGLDHFPRRGLHLGFS